jgi:hypothetical protein
LRDLLFPFHFPCVRCASSLLPVSEGRWIIETDARLGWAICGEAASVF